MIYLGADHRGYQLLHYLSDKLQQEGQEVKVYESPRGVDPTDDYTDYAFEVSKAVADDPDGVGILICGSGVGVDVVANKVTGVRSALVFDPDQGKEAREHDNVNVLSLAADALDEELAWEITQTFLSSQFSGEQRHIRRLKKIEFIEKHGYQISLIPSILATSEEEYHQKLVKIWKYSSRVHIDFMDNKFVHNKSISVAEAEADGLIGKMYQEAHLMVINPGEWIQELLNTGVDRVIIPVEDLGKVDEAINLIRAENPDIEVGVSVNPETSLLKVQPYLSRVDMVLVMSVHPGFGGQPFIPESLEKIKALRELDSKLIIGVDGGITQDIVRDIVEAGANELVIGANLLEGDVDENIKQFNQAIYQ